MSTIVWERKISKGNSKGTGWLSMPKELESSLELDSHYNLSLYDEKMGHLELLVKLVENKGCLGFYIPKILCEKYALLRKKVEVIV